MVKMVRFFTCLLSIFFIFFASVPVSYASSFEKNPLQFELSDLKFITRTDGSHYAQGYMSWGNVSPYEIIELKGSVDLFNKQGQKITAKPKYFEDYDVKAGDNELDTHEIVNFDLIPTVTHPSQIEAAYLKPTYTFTLGKKAELKANVIIDTINFDISAEENKIYTYALLINQGEATATNFKYSGLSFTDTNGMLHFYPETNHSVINSSLKVEPGHFVTASSEIPLDFITSRFKNYNDIRKISIAFTHDNSVPYKEDTAVSVTVNNKKLVQQTFVENDVTYVSLRELADVLGATIQWDDPTQTATVILRDNFMEYDRQIVIPVGSDRFINDGLETTVSGKAQLHNNTILVVPLRDVADMLDCYVVFEHKWGQKTIIVIPYNVEY